MGLFLSNDENPVVGGLFSLLLFLPVGSLLVPLCLAITAELVERKVQSRAFSWPKVRPRFLVAIPMAIGPLYTALFVVMRLEDRRPPHWLETAVLLCCLSAVFAYFSLRIRKPAIHPHLGSSKGDSPRFVSHNLGKFGRYFLLGLSILGIFLALDRLYGDFYPLFNSLGESDQGCNMRSDVKSVPSGTGMVATTHLTACDSWSPLYTTYVYVHRAGESDSAHSLVFSFDAESDDLKIVWTDNSNLRISISEVGDARKQITSMDGVKISYSIGKEGYAPEAIARLLRHDEELSLAWLIFCTGIWIRYLKNRETSVSVAGVMSISVIWLFFASFPFWEELVRAYRGGYL